MTRMIGGVSQFFHSHINRISSIGVSRRNAIAFIFEM